MAVAEAKKTEQVEKLSKSLKNVFHMWSWRLIPR